MFNRLYDDAGRADELREENQVAHPLFAPRIGVALSRWTTSHDFDEASPVARAFVADPVPNPDEVATIVVGGRKWDDWTSVKVENRYAEAFDLPTFSNVERPTTVQFRPGGQASGISLGGELGDYRGRDRPRVHLCANNTV